MNLENTYLEQFEVPKSGLNADQHMISPTLGVAFAPILTVPYLATLETPNVMLSYNTMIASESLRILLPSTNANQTIAFEEYEAKMDPAVLSQPHAALPRKLTEVPYLYLPRYSSY